MHIAKNDRDPSSACPVPLTLTDKIATALGSAAIVLVVGAVALIGTRRANDATLLVSHTRQVAGALQRLTARVTDAETGQRGYLLTHDEQFLGPVAGAEGDATRALLALRQLTSDNVRQQQRLDTLVPLVAERVALLQQTIDRTRAGRSDSTAEHGELRRGEAVMDRLRVLTDSMGAEEQHLLIDRQRRAASERASANVVIIGGTLLAFVLATLGIRFLGDAARAEQTAAARLREQQEELEVQAGELEHRVAEHEVANEELATANEELSERTTEVARASALLDAFLHAAPVGLAFFDLDFRFSRVNQRWAEIGGLIGRGVPREDTWRGAAFARRAVAEQLASRTDHGAGADQRGERAAARRRRSGAQLARQRLPGRRAVSAR